MKTSQIFAISALAISTMFFTVLSLFGLPESVVEWFISDVILGTIIYINYLVITVAYNSKKNSVYSTEKKIAA
jgi:hypothetical protein